MIIQTLSRDYYMIQRLKHSDDLDIYLCKNKKENSSHVIYRLIRLKKEEFSRAAITIFMDQKDNKANKDFVECFPKDGEFYVVFINSNEDRLERKLQNEQCNLAERLEIGKNIIEKMILLNIPYFMQYEALDASNLSVSKSLEIGFDFTLESLMEQDNIDLIQVSKRYGQVCRLLFSEEIGIEASEELNKFIERLESGDFDNYFLIYQAYDVLYKKLVEMHQTGQVKPGGFWFRVWEKTKRIFTRLKPVLFAIILVIIVGYLIYMLMRSKETTQAKTTFKSIGTVEIQKAYDTEATKTPVE